MRHFENLVEKHAEIEVLEICAETLELLCKKVSNARCNTSRITIIDSFVDNFREAHKHYAALTKVKHRL